MFKFVIEAEIRATEDPKRLLQAFRNLIPDLTPQIHASNSASLIRAEGGSASNLLGLHSLLRKGRILDAARKSLLARVRGNRLEFMLNKQAAFSGRISFCDSEDESPLGPIRLIVECSNPALLVEWLAPKTMQGRPLRELPRPSFD